MCTGFGVCDFWETDFTDSSSKRRGNLAGPLPETWFQEGAFPALEFMWFVQFPLSGPLPLYLPFDNTLTTLKLEGTHITGTLPQEWAHPNAFQQLSLLIISAGDVTGRPPQACSVMLSLQGSCIHKVAAFLTIVQVRCGCYTCT